MLNFLASLFEQEYHYRSVNSYRSTISTVHKKADGEEVGKHPFVYHTTKRIFNEMPPRPKYGMMNRVPIITGFDH